MEVLSEPLSWSRASTYSTCGEKFRLSYIEKVPREASGAGIAGSAIHQVIEEHAAGSLTNALSGDTPAYLVPVLMNRFTKLFATALAEAGEVRWSGRKSKEWPEKENADWWLTAAPAMFENYLAILADDDERGIKTLATEAHVVVPDMPSSWQGYIDRVLVDGDGALMVSDWKTGSKYPDTVFQLASYALAWEKSQGVAVDKGEVVNLRKNLDREEFDLRPAKALIESMYADTLAGITAGLFPAKVSNMCVACGVRAHCAAYAATGGK